MKEKRRQKRRQIILTKSILEGEDHQFIVSLLSQMQPGMGNDVEYKKLDTLKSNKKIELKTERTKSSVHQILNGPNLHAHRTVFWQFGTTEKTCLITKIIWFHVWRIYRK